ncbi:ankyrin repeat domain-containing protein [Streptomyces alkaliphilus]|uniref:ankyrin repeat domain-containing protein n=1 Tax=Streptomyces alkaliphilus TaxID=1472722 RepID=UPI00117E370E|nr:ankyrin repeat domain-containing protein [Streptomyces alkaliphilus]MQS09191.1 ankyrin repeat domain-containing protein [Streptomyces alkaliphilus]
MSPVHLAVETQNTEKLGDLLDRGADIHEEHHGLTLLHHAIDVEVDGHTQTGEPLRVDTTALLLARGADPRRRSGGGTGVSAEHMALVGGHRLASRLIAEWLRAHPEVPDHEDSGGSTPRRCRSHPEGG